MKKFSFRRPKLAATLSLLAAVVTALPAQSAERIQFFVGPFEPTIYIDDLETFANTGEIEPRLQPFANRFNSEQQETLRAFLNASYDISPVPVSQFTNSYLGELLLQKAGQVIQTENRLSGMKAIRAALVLAAADEDSDFNTINILRHFPGQTIQLDFPLAKQVAAEGQQIFRRRDTIVNNIKEIAQAQATSPTTIPPNDPKFSGPYTWQTQTFTFQTPERPTESLADLYVPDIATDNIPVIIISHGVASNRGTFAYLAEHLASHGYAVVTLEHSETSSDRLFRFFWAQDRAPDPIDLLHRPQDITAVLNELVQQQAIAPSTSPLKNFNLQSVGLLGQSLGGYTALASAGAAIDWQYLENSCAMLQERPSLNFSMFVQCSLLQVPKDTSLEVADPRVSAIIALNPLSSAIFGPSGLENISIPVMLVAGTEDYIAPAIPEQIEPFTRLKTTDKTLVVMEGGTHFSFLNPDSDGAIPFTGNFTGPDPEKSRPQIQALSLAFFNRHLKNQPEAEAFISQRYLNTFPTTPFQFSLVKRIALE